MDRLPDELLLYIISFLNAKETALIQGSSHRFLQLTRDDNLWRTKCFQRSHAERRRQVASNPDTQLNVQNNAPLVRALAGLLRVPDPEVTVHDPGAPSAEFARHQLEVKERARALANWDPSYPKEKINFYQEYIQRHAPISLSWFEEIKEGLGKPKEAREATGAALLYDDAGQNAKRLFAALDDGSVGVWNLSSSSSRAKRGRLLSRSPPGLLTGHTSSSKTAFDLTATKGIMTATGAIECVSLDQSRRKGFFAVQDNLVQVDLETLQQVSVQVFPSPIYALSECKAGVPMTIGTNMSVHLHDSRAPLQPPSTANQSVRLELIAGQPRLGLHSYNTISQLLSPGTQARSETYATLSQPGPLSIVHTPEDSDWDGNGQIWVSGRFTSLLNYDRRYFPRLRGSVHSGARISSLRLLPYPFVPPEFSSTFGSYRRSIAEINEYKSIPGNTLLAAGEYKGKASLELYGLSSDPTRGVLSSDYRGTAVRAKSTTFQNRQTAARTKLLSATGHGGKIVFSDGDGNVKWVERDGFTPVRSWNINDAIGRQIQSHLDIPEEIAMNTFTSDAIPPPDDIVQLLLPTMPKAALGHNRIGEDNLVMWTGDGRLGLLSFGHDGKWDHDGIEEQVENSESNTMIREEREFSGMMGRALRRQQDELNFMRTFGMRA